MKQAMLIGVLAAIAHADMTPKKYNMLKSVSRDQICQKTVQLTNLFYLAIARCQHGQTLRPGCQAPEQSRSLP